MKTLPLSSKSFATACLAAHRRHLSRREEEVLEKVIVGAPLSDKSNVSDHRGEPDYTYTEVAVYRALRNQYLGELSR